VSLLGFLINWVITSYFCRSQCHVPWGRLSL